MIQVDVMQPGFSVIVFVIELFKKYLITMTDYTSCLMWYDSFTY